MAQNITEKLLPQVPEEPNITKDQDYNLIVMLSPTSNATRTKISLKKPVCEIIPNQLAGCGKVDLVKLELTYMTSKKGEHINLGVANANVDLKARQVGMSEGGYSHVSNEFNYGEKRTVTIVVPDILTRQIQPASSMAMPLKLYLSANKDTRIMLHLFLKIHGPRIERIEMDF